MIFWDTELKRDSSVNVQNGNVGCVKGRTLLRLDETVIVVCCGNNGHVVESHSAYQFRNGSADVFRRTGWRDAEADARRSVRPGIGISYLSWMRKFKSSKIKHFSTIWIGYLWINCLGSQLSSEQWNQLVECYPAAPLDTVQWKHGVYCSVDEVFRTDFLRSKVNSAVFAPKTGRCFNCQTFIEQTDAVKLEIAEQSFGKIARWLVHCNARTTLWCVTIRIKCLTYSSKPKEPMSSSCERSWGCHFGTADRHFRWWQSERRKLLIGWEHCEAVPALLLSKVNLGFAWSKCLWICPILSDADQWNFELECCQQSQQSTEHILNLARCRQLKYLKISCGRNWLMNLVRLSGKEWASEEAMTYNNLH